MPEEGDLLDVPYYNFTGEGVQGPVSQALNSSNQASLFEEGLRNHTQATRWVAVDPPQSALFAIFPLLDSNNNPVSGSYNIQWATNGNRSIKTSTAGSIRIDLLNYLKKYCMMGYFVYWHKQKIRFRNSTELASCIFDFNPELMPTYVPAVDYQKKINAEIDKILAYAKIPPETLEYRISTGLNNASLSSLGLSQQANQFNVESDYHLRLMSVLNHITDVNSPLEAQLVARDLTAAWGNFKQVLEQENPTNKFDKLLLYRIEDVYRHPNLPVDNRRMLEIYKQDHPIHFRDENQYFVNPALTGISYYLTPLGYTTMKAYLFDYRVTAEPRVAAGEAKRAGAPSKEELCKDIANFERLLDDKDNKKKFDANLVKRVKNGLKKVIDLFDKEDTKDAKRVVIVDAEEEIRELKNRYDLVETDATKELMSDLDSLHSYPPNLSVTLTTVNRENTIAQQAQRHEAFDDEYDELSVEDSDEEQDEVEYEEDSDEDS